MIKHRQPYGGQFLIVSKDELETFEKSVNDLIEHYSKATYFADRGEWAKNALRMKGIGKGLIESLKVEE